MLVFADADLDQAVQGAIITKFRNTGQSCIAANRVYVERAIYEQFLERLVAKTQGPEGRQRPGRGRGNRPADQRGRPSIKPWRRSARPSPAARGSSAAAGDGRAACGGHFLEPTILVDVPPTARCMREETFAPVCRVCAFDDEERGHPPGQRHVLWLGGLRLHPRFVADVATGRIARSRDDRHQRPRCPPPANAPSAA